MLEGLLSPPLMIGNSVRQDSPSPVLSLQVKGEDSMLYSMFWISLASTDFFKSFMALLMRKILLMTIFKLFVLLKKIIIDFQIQMIKTHRSQYLSVFIKSNKNVSYFQVYYRISS